MEITGKIIAVLEARGGVSKTTGNTWKTQDYVIETHEQFPHRMCFNVFGEDKIAQMNIQVGDELTVYFDVNAREYQGRWFNDIRAWKVERVVPGVAPAGDPTPFPPQAAAPSQQAAPAQPVDFTSENSADDLPF
jgi:hypothetical protein